MARVVISASHKSSGKTTITAGIARALADQGLAVQTFKKGPDYIDPMWLSLASGRTCFNLDFNTQSAGEIVRMASARAATADLSLIEGNMGLHDGVAVDGSDSSAALAALLEAPIVLVVDCEGMTRSVAALVLGFEAFDRRIRIAGVILNRLAGARQEQKIRAALEAYTDVPVIGAVARSSEIAILERHLGLTTPGEMAAAEKRIAALAAVVRASIDLDRVRSILSSAAPLAVPAAAATRLPTAAGEPVTIAIAKDSAFGFYYPDDIEAFERAGARLIPFSPLADRALPPADGCFIGGGFPETHMAALAANATLRADIRRKAAAGMPIYAECGGLMYLAREIRWGAERAAMCGVVDADVVMHEKPQGRGLARVAPTPDFPWWPGIGEAQPVAAHEFHHAALAGLSPATHFAWRVLRGQGIDGQNDGIIVGNVLAAFVHQRDTAANPWVERFVAFVRKVKRERSALATGSRLGERSMTTRSDRLTAVFNAIDKANSDDPRSIVVNGLKRPYEVVYSERMTERLAIMYPDASELLQIAARAQHIRRWDIPRDRYPEGRAGYNDWRRACREHHAALIGEIMAQHGYSPSEIAHVGMIIKKEQLKKDKESQALENVVDVVFVEHYFDEFLGKYSSYDDAKIIDILGKTLRKMSPKGHAAALALDLPERTRRLIMAAVEREKDTLAKLAAVAID